MFGRDSVSSAELVQSHRPERAFQLTPFCPPRKPQRTRKKQGGKRKATKRQQASLPLVMNGMSGALRLVDPPTPQPVDSDLKSITIEGVQSPVVASFGPTKVDNEWWSSAPVARDYYEVETEDGGRYWVFKRKDDDRYYLHGIFD